MRFPFRQKHKKKGGDALGSIDIPNEFRPEGATRPPLFPPTHRSSELLAHMPPAVLERIFSFVCPHTQDESYETCEGSANENGCMLCDLRDISHCGRVCRTWRGSAVKVLYHSVRIDPVHYCPLEAWLAERRKKTSRFDRNGVPEDPAQARLRLLRRTVRDDPTRVGKLVEYLKIPYMLRESAQVELAQTIAVLPHLKYVDLPEGMFSDDSHYSTLRLEVQARCPNLRKMTYLGGSEESFAMLASGTVWPNLEVLELTDLNIDPMTLRSGLAAMGNLQALKVSNVPSFSDEVLSSGDGYQTLMPIKELVLKDTPAVTVKGLVEFLAWQGTQQALTVLTLKDTGVQPAGLAEVLTMATSLKTLAIQSKVAEPFPHGANLRPLASRRLQTLRFELSGASSTGGFSSITTGYYGYLASSILAGGFPRLRRLYVHDDSFPEQLSGLPPPMASFAGGHARTNSNPIRSPAAAGDLPPMPRGPMSPPRRPISNVTDPSKRLSSNNPFARRAAGGGGGAPPTHALEVFTKNDEFGKWNFASVDAFVHSAASAGPSKRPLSTYGLAADVSGAGWDRGEARRSVMVGNGTGGFLALPGQDLSPPPRFDDMERPHSSAGEESRRSRDLWR